MDVRCLCIKVCFFLFPAKRGQKPNPAPQTSPEHAPLIITEEYVLFLA